MNKGLLILILAGLMVACGAADSGEPAASVDAPALEKKLKGAFGPTVGIKVLGDAPVDGFYSVELGGSDIVYVSRDGQHIFAGKLLEIRDGEVADLSDQRYETRRRKGIAKLASKNLITFQADNEKAEVYAFTDITCGYCRKLHRHIEEYNQAGVTVHYLAFPRGGTNRPAAEAMRHIWCADDRQKALTQAKLERKMIDNTLGACADTVDQQYKLGQTFGVAGTPAIFSVDGKQLGGYVTPKQLLSRLDL